MTQSLPMYRYKTDFPYEAFVQHAVEQWLTSPLSGFGRPPRVTREAHPRSHNRVIDKA